MQQTLALARYESSVIAAEDVDDLLDREAGVSVVDEALAAQCFWWVHDRSVQVGGPVMDVAARVRSAGAGRMSLTGSDVVSVAEDEKVSDPDAADERGQGL